MISWNSLGTPGSHGFYHFFAWEAILAWSLFSTLYLMTAAKVDERKCTNFFGVAYQEYMQRTKRFVPYIY